MAGSLFRTADPGDQALYDGDRQEVLSAVATLRSLVSAQPKRVAGGNTTAYVPPAPSGGGTGGGGSSSGGTVTFFSASAPSWLTPLVTNPGTTPNLALTATTGLAANSVLATDPSTGALVVRALVATDFPNSGVAAGSYTSANITVDVYGRVTVAANGTGGGGVPTSRLINTTNGLIGGGDLTADRTLSLSNYSGATTGYLPTKDGAGGLTWIAVPSGGSVTLAGDATGPSGSNTVVAIQSVPIAASGPATGNVLTYNGTNWSGADTGGDLSGHLGSVTVVGLRTVNVSAAAPTNGQALIFMSGPNAWTPTTLPAAAPVIMTGTQATGSLSLGIATTVAVTFSGAFADTSYFVVLTPVLGSGVTTGTTYGVIAGTQTTTGFSFTITAAALITAGVNVNYVAVHS